MKMKVTVHRNKDYFPELIEIKRGRRAKVSVEQTPSPTGEVYNIEIEGKRDRLPSFTEVLAMVNARRLDRIGTIETVDELTLLKVLEELTLLKEITTIKKIETIDNIPSITLYGSAGIALAQGAGTGAEWVSPTDHEDVVHNWLLEERAYDEDDGTSTSCLCDFGIDWYGFLELHLASAILSNKITFKIRQERLGDVPDGIKVDIDVEKDGSWSHVDEITDFAQETFIEKSFTQGNVTKARLRFYNPIELETIARIYEVKLWQVATAGGELKVDATMTLREDLTSFGGVASPNNTGVKVVDGEAEKTIKVYDAGYESLAEGIHYFYFGTTTSPTTKRFLTSKSDGCFHKTLLHARIGEAGDSLYLFSAVSETNMPYDVGYVKE